MPCCLMPAMSDSCVRRVEAGGPFVRLVPFDPPRIARTKGSTSYNEVDQKVAVTYYGPSQLLNFTWPVLGPVDGGNRITVSGANFLDTGEILFKFNTGETESVTAIGEYVSSTKATFIAPKLPRPDRFQLDIAMNTQYFRGQTLLYRTIPVPIVTHMQPKSGYTMSLCLLSGY